MGPDVVIEAIHLLFIETRFRAYMRRTTTMGLTGFHLVVTLIANMRKLDAHPSFANERLCKCSFGNSTFHLPCMPL